MSKNTFLFKEEIQQYTDYLLEKSSAELITKIIDEISSPEATLPMTFWILSVYELQIQLSAQSSKDNTDNMDWINVILRHNLYPGSSNQSLYTGFSGTFNPRNVDFLFFFKHPNPPSDHCTSILREKITSLILTHLEASETLKSFCSNTETNNFVFLASIQDILKHPKFNSTVKHTLMIDHSLDIRANPILYYYVNGQDQNHDKMALSFDST